MDVELDSIIAGCRKNDRNAQKILYDRYFETLYGHCQQYRLTDQDVISLINRTMLSVFQNINSFQGNSAFTTWMYTIHKNHILNHFRSATRERKRVVYDSDAVSWWGQENGDTTRETDLEHIRQAMQSLPEQTRTVLELYAIEGYKHKEIARKLRISESNSKYHLGKARELMADKLRQNHG